MTTVLLASSVHKRVLLVIWILRTALTLCLLTYFILTLDWISEKDYFSRPILVVAIIIMILLVAVLMIDVFSIIVLARNRLLKFWLLMIQTAHSIIWGMLLMMMIIAATLVAENQLPMFLVFFVLVFISSLSLTIWAVFIYRSSRLSTTDRQVLSSPEISTHDPEHFCNEYVSPPPPYTATAARYG